MTLFSLFGQRSIVFLNAPAESSGGVNTAMIHTFTRPTYPLLTGLIEMTVISNGISKALRRAKSSAGYWLRHFGIKDEKASLYRDWELRQFAAPSPNFVKRAVLLRNGLKNATWVETGTYLGETTRVLSQVAKLVYSIEPEPTLFAKALHAFKDSANVRLLNGLSEELFPRLLPTLSGDICFWLDGHYSDGLTHRGPKETPILDELRAISENIETMGEIVVLVDDMRCFRGSQVDCSSYPTVQAVADWANENRLKWHIEHDIFVAKS